MKNLALITFSFLLCACSTTTNLYVDHLSSHAENDGFSEHTLTLGDNEHYTQIHYWDNQKESDNTVILIHGVGGDGLLNWQSSMMSLGEQYRVIVPDILWYGQSSSDLEPTLEDQVSAIADLLKQLDVKGNIHLVGHSYGGFIVYGLLADYDFAATATFISSPGGAFDQKDLQALLARFDVEKPSDLFVPKNDVELKRLLNATSEDHVYAPAFTMDGFYDRYFAENIPQKGEMLDHLMDSREAFVRKIASKSLPPIQIIWGENDQIFPLESATVLAEQSNAPLYIVTDSAHNILLEKPDTVNRLLNQFVAKNLTAYQ
ncbi:MAG: alpha/beta fold hydrolase [Vibrio sp.]